MKNYHSKKPNTFFIGAPKCGTTAMAQYLSTHPNVCVSKPKEPNFFIQGAQDSRYESVDDYLKKCFYHCQKEDVLIDGSIKSLQADGAIKRILDFNPDARFLIMLRNPIDAAYSLYSMYKSRLKEDARSFKMAWYRDLGKKERINGRMPNKENGLLNYKETFLYGQQIEKLFSMVSKNQVKIVLFRNFKNDPKRAYLRFIDYLNISQEINTHFPEINQDNRSKSKIVKKALDALSDLKKALGVPRFHSGVFSKVYSLNSRRHNREPLSDNFRDELKQHFADNAEKLKELTGIDILNKSKR